MNSKKIPRLFGMTSGFEKGIPLSFILTASRFSLSSIAVLFALSISVGATEMREKIVFTCSVSAKLPIFKAAESNFQKAFGALGYDFELIESANGKRGLTDAMSGIYDGDCARPEELNEWVTNSHLIRVNVKIVTSFIGAWTSNPNLIINSADDLKNKSVRIGSIKGILASDNYLAENRLTSVVDLNNLQSGIKLLNAGRIDILIASTDGMKSQLAQSKITTGIYLAGNLKSYGIFPYMHEKRKELVPLLEAELKKQFLNAAAQSVPKVEKINQDSTQPRH